MNSQQSIAIPSDFKEAKTIQERVLFALARLGEGTADKISRELEALAPEIPDKEVIAGVHKVLTDLHTQGRIGASEKEGTLIFSLNK
ncbi:hypothetical protein FO440_14975 [Mucilaginibacter corticis]|uniref:Uncharacterized protein n=1 Tax=Mucilaginibacter corticis TaxID=2597670 RepID=A0A556MM74_9SPHI|nr:hypothetical protein [Mucilaginibacter corticis]TSJ41034.1 hypothetical protein FO440_14975 [Mucilaginibacter corticis]